MADSIANVSIKFNADDKSAYSAIDRLEKRLRDLEKTKPIKVNAIADSTGVTKLQNQIKNIASKTTATINLDTVPALRGIDVLKARYDVLAKRIQERVSSGIDVNSSSLQGQLTQLGVMKSKLADLAKSKVDFSSIFSSAGGVLSGVADKLSSIGNKFSLLSAGGAVGLGAVFKNAVLSSADLASNLGQLQALLGATDDQMAKLQKTSIDLGNDITLPGVSATDASNAMSELAKNGISLQDSMNGAKSVLQLAKIANIAYADSARIVATQLNIFGLSGTEATRVSEYLSKASGASGSSITEMADATNQAGLVAKSSGFSFEQMSDALALMSKNGLRGSDAGTSLKNALIRLSAPTTEASNEMEKYGINVRDASGKLKSIRDLAGEFSTKMKGLTQEQKDNALATILGTDAIRVGNILVEEGANGYDKLTDKIKKTGGASQQLAGQNKGLRGFLDAIKSSIDTILLELGDKLQPILTKTAKKFSDFISNFDFAKLATDITNFVEGAIPKIENLAKKFLEFTKLIGGGNTAVGIERLATGFLLFGPVLKILAPLVSVVGGLSKAIGAVISTGGFSALFSGASTGALSGLSTGLSAIISAISGFAFSIGALVAGLVLIGGGAKSVLRDIGGVFSGVKDILLGFINIIRGIFSGNGNIIKDGFIAMFSGLGTLAGTLLHLISDIILFAFKGAVKLLIGLNPFLQLPRLLFDSKFRDGVLNTLKDVFLGAFEAVKGLVANFVSSVSGGKIKLFDIDKVDLTKPKADLQDTKNKVDALKSSLDLLSGKTLDLSQAELSLQNLNIQLAEAQRLTQEALNNAGGNTQDPAYIQALTNELGIKQQILTTNDTIRVSQQELNTEYGNFIAKVAEGTAINQADKDSLLGKLELLKQQREALGGNSAEIQTMIDKVTTVNATPVDVKTSTNAPETSGKLDETKGRMDNINANPATATVEVNDQASSTLSNIFNIISNIPLKKTIEVVGNVAGNLLDALGLSTGGIVPVYRAKGGAIDRVKTLYAKTGSSVFKPKGTDTVPAMLTPGEFVTRRGIVSRFGKDFFSAQNNGNIGAMIKELISKEPKAVLQALKQFSVPSSNFDYQDIMSGISIPNTVASPITNNNQKNITINANFSSNSSQRAGEFAMLNNFQNLIATGGI